jgi:teichuronic acid exporter
LRNNKTTIISSLLWKLTLQGGAQGIQFIIQIVLARLLFPADYGLIAIVNAFVLIANVFVESGFTTALIQKKDADELDFSSVFYLSLFVAAFIYILLFFTSPLLSAFFNMPKLDQVMKVFSITLFFGAINSVQNAFVVRNMMFKKLFFSSITALLVSGSIGITAAYLGLGVWALVIHQLTYRLLLAITLWFSVKWRPKLLFSVDRVKALLAFGWKILAASLLNTIYMDIRSLVIGKIYAPEMLGFYNRGAQFPRLIIVNANNVIRAIMLPVLSSTQDNILTVKFISKRAIKTTSLIMLPMIIGLAVIAEPLVKIVLTEKWLPSVSFLQILCLGYILFPIQSANLEAILALGRSDIFLKLEIINKFIGLCILGVSIPFGIYAIAWGASFSVLVASIINAYFNLKLLNYGYLEQWKDFYPSLFMSLAMGAIVYSIRFFNISDEVTLLLQLLIGVVSYILIAKIFKIEAYAYLYKAISDIFTRKKERIL